MALTPVIAALTLAFSLLNAQERDAPREPPSRLAAAIESLPPAPGSGGVWRSLHHRMDSVRAPGLSVAVIEGYRVADVAVYGVVDARGGGVVTPATRFQAASLSKPVFALGVLRLVQRGVLELDAPVNAVLRGWQVPPSAGGSAEQVTVRRLLNHTAGLTMSAVPPYPPDVSLPPLIDVLRGDSGSRSQGVRVDAPPGSRTAYSGGGYAVAQLLIEEATGLPAASAMDTLVLRPLGMAHSTFEQPLRVALHASAASGHRDDGTVVSGRWRVFNVVSAAGLWTTPTDFARYIIAVQRAVQGFPGAVLDSRLARAMLEPERAGGVRGLGPVVRTVDGTRTFSHGGWNGGYRAYFAATLDGRGVIVFANGNRAGELVRDVARQAALAYGWRIPD